ncbi:MAG TPA: membrane protein insertase YidC [Candidatus Limnocylindrales bacterium]
MSTSQRRGRVVLLGVLAVLTFLALFAGVMPASAESPSASIAPVATPAPADTGTPATTPAPGASSLPGGANPAVPQPPCPLPAATPTPTPEVTPSLAPGESPPPATPGPTPVPHALCPAVLTGNPGDLLAYLFNPIFQTMFLGLAAGYQLFGDVGIAIIVLTLIIKTILIPLTRAQIVSQRRMQMLQPEIRALQAKYKGNRTKVNEETMRLYRERGVNPASGCLPSFLQLFLLIPIYSVINTGLGAPDISSALQVLGVPVLQGLTCHDPGTLQPCINPLIAWLGLDAHLPQHSFILPVIGFSVSFLALAAAFLQLIQTRMAQPRTSDPQQASQQRIFLLLPLFSIIYGAFLPAGLFLYWIVFTGYSIVQQYLIAGWGSLFPIFGWTPGFAVDYTPRFAPKMPTPKPSNPTPSTSSDKGAGARPTDQDNRTATDRAAGTIKPARGRSRRGRRR